MLSSFEFSGTVIQSARRSNYEQTSNLRSGTDSEFCSSDSESVPDLGIAAQVKLLFLEPRVPLSLSRKQ